MAGYKPPLPVLNILELSTEYGGRDGVQVQVQVHTLSYRPGRSGSLVLTAVSMVGLTLAVWYGSFHLSTATVLVQVVEELAGRL